MNILLNKKQTVGKQGDFNKIPNEIIVPSKRSTTPLTVSLCYENSKYEKGKRKKSVNTHACIF